MNYLGLNGLLGLSGDADGRRFSPRARSPTSAAARASWPPSGSSPPCASASARARGSSWTCRCSTARSRGSHWWPRSTSPTRSVPRRRLPLAGGLLCYRPYACRDGWVTLGALEPKFWQEWCRGVGREDLVEKQFEPPRSDAHGKSSGSSLSARATSGRRSPPSTTAASSPCSASTRPSTRARPGARDGREARAARGGGLKSGCSVPVKLSRTPGAPAGPGARRSASTRARCSPSWATRTTRSSP